MVYYEANVSIYCVDGAIEGILSSDPNRLLGFLNERDHEGSSVSMVLRVTPTVTKSINDPEEVYRKLRWWKKRFDRSQR